MATARALIRARVDRSVISAVVMAEMVLFLAIAL